MTFDGLLTAFAAKLHNLTTLIASFYIGCVFWAYFHSTQGYTVVANFLSDLGLKSMSSYFLTVVTSLTNGDSLNFFRLILFVWFTVSLVFLAGGYAAGPRNDLLPQSAISTAFFWSLTADLIEKQSIVGTHSLLLGGGIAAIAFLNLKHGKEFWVAPLMATFAIAISPLYVVAAFPFWFSTESGSSEIAKSLASLKSEVRLLRELLENGMPLPESQAR